MSHNIHIAADPPPTSFVAGIVRVRGGQGGARQGSGRKTLQSLSRVLAKVTI